MAEIACSDLGTDCSFVAKADTAEGMQEVVMAHAADTHPELLENMTPETEAEIGAAIAGAFAG